MAVDQVTDAKFRQVPDRGQVVLARLIGRESRPDGNHMLLEIRETIVGNRVPLEMKDHRFSIPAFFNGGNLHCQFIAKSDKYSIKESFIGSSGEAGKSGFSGLDRAWSENIGSR